MHSRMSNSPLAAVGEQAQQVLGEQDADDVVAVGVDAPGSASGRTRRRSAARFAADRRAARMTICARGTMMSRTWMSATPSTPSSIASASESIRPRSRASRSCTTRSRAVLGLAGDGPGELADPGAGGLAGLVVMPCLPVIGVGIGESEVREQRRSRVAPCGAHRRRARGRSRAGAGCRAPPGAPSGRRASCPARAPRGRSTGAQITRSPRLRGRRQRAAAAHGAAARRGAPGTTARWSRGPGRASCGSAGGSPPRRRPAARPRGPRLRGRPRRAPSCRGAPATGPRRAPRTARRRRRRSAPSGRHGGGSAARRLCIRARLVGLHDPLHQRMAHHVARLEEREADALDPAQHVEHVPQAGRAGRAGRSIWVTSPVTTACEPKPMRVRNIFICSMVVFCASSRMMKESFSVRPRMKASGATSMTLRSMSLATRSKPIIS